MTIEVLVSTMNRKDDYFLENMNLQTDVIVGNQNGENYKTVLKRSFGTVNFISSDTKGLSNNRNITLINSNAEICLLCDDDLKYLDGYEEIIQKAYRMFPSADIIIFNLYENPVKRFRIRKPFIVNRFNYMRFGSVRISFKRTSIVEKKILFDPRFGSGADIPMGEDSIFLHDCIKEGLKIMAIPEYLLSLNDCSKSTWFTGYNKTYLINKGKFYYRVYNRLWPFFVLQDVIRHRKLYNQAGNFFKNFELMKQGADNYKRNNL